MVCAHVWGHGVLRLLFQPLIAMSGDEVVVVKMRVRAMDAVNLGKLPRAQRFMLIETPESFEQALAAQDFVQSGDAAAESVCSIEEGGVAVGDFDTETH